MKEYSKTSRETVNGPVKLWIPLFKNRPSAFIVLYEVVKFGSAEEKNHIRTVDPSVLQ